MGICVYNVGYKVFVCMGYRDAYVTVSKGTQQGGWSHDNLDMYLTCNPITCTLTCGMCRLTRNLTTGHFYRTPKHGH